MIGNKINWFKIYRKKSCESLLYFIGKDKALGEGNNLNFNLGLNFMRTTNLSRKNI